MIRRAFPFLHRACRSGRSSITLAVSFLLVLTFSGCLTRLPSKAAPPGSFVLIAGVSANVWTDRACGAGALSTVLGRFGVVVAETDLFRELPKAKEGGVLPIDLVLAARNRGFDAHLIRGSRSDVVRLVSEGLPPILMLQVADFPGESRDLLHYVVVDGVTSDGARVRMLFGDGERRWSAFENLDRAWRGGGYAMVIVRPADNANDPPADLVAAAIALERSGDAAAAAARYRELSGMYPRSALVLTNLGNAEMGQGRRAEAEMAYELALKLDPDFRDALNNLAWLLLAEGRDLERAEGLATRAVALRGRDSHVCADTLARIQIARDNCAGAETTYQAAMDGATGEAGESILRAVEEMRVNCRANGRK